MSTAETRSSSSTRPDTKSPGGVLAGVGWMIVTTLLFAAVTGIVRHVGSEIPAAEAAFLRYLFGAILVLPAMAPLLRAPPPSRTLAVFALRGLVHGIGVILWFYAMARIPVAEVTALGYLAPLFVTLGAALVFGEPLHRRRLLAVLAGLVGAMIIVRPGFTEVSLGQLAQIAAAPLFAASYLIAKRLTDDEDPAVIVGMLSLVCTLVLLPGALLHWRAPSLAELGWFALTAVIATAGHYCMTRALRAAPVTVTQPVSFLQLVWATAMGVALFGEPLDPFVLLGGGIVVAAATFIAHREVQLARRHPAPPPPAVKL